MKYAATERNIRRDRFVRIVERRVNEILHNLDNLGKCSNKKNYEYSDSDIKKVFKTINGKVREIQSLFQDMPRSKKQFKLEK